MSLAREESERGQTETLTVVWGGFVEAETRVWVVTELKRGEEKTALDVSAME